MKVTSKGQEFSLQGEAVVLRKARGVRRRGGKLVQAMRGKATMRMTTDQIMALTRGD